MNFRHSLAVSLAALLCTASMALAQTPDKGGAGGGAGQAPAEKMEKGQSGAGSGQERKQPARGMNQSQERRGDKATEHGAGKSAQGEAGKDQDKAGRMGRETSKGEDKAQRTGRDKGERTGQDMSRDKTKGEDKTQRTGQDMGRDKAKGEDKAQRTGQDTGRDKAKGEDKTQRTGQDMGRDKAKGEDKTQRTGRDTGRDKGEGKAAQEQRTPDKQGQMQQTKRVEASEKQHAEVRTHLLRDRNIQRTDRRKLNVSVNIGSTLPRSVRLHPLVTAVIDVAPVYRGYSYVLLEDDTIVIVDPHSYAIVDVIPASTQRAERSGPRGHLTLSSDQRRFVLSHIDRKRSADLSVRLALGAEVPNSIEVAPFPEPVIERIPELRSYRYVVAQDQVVIVDPNDHQVALLISE